MAHFLKRSFLLFALLVGAWLLVYSITNFVTLSPKTEFALQQYAIGTALVVFIAIVAYERVKMNKDL